MKKLLMILALAFACAATMAVSKSDAAGLAYTTPTNNKMACMCTTSCDQDGNNCVENCVGC